MSTRFDWSVPFRAWARQVPARNRRTLCDVLRRSRRVFGILGEDIRPPFRLCTLFPLRLRWASMTWS
jgi:hypothetical protein